MTPLNHSADISAAAAGSAFSYENPFIRRARRPTPSVRLFCFPHAGAGASAFIDWPALLPADIEVVAVQLPGREDRTQDKPFTRVAPLVRSLAQVIRPYLDVPLAFFGHSGGAALAFELARTLRQRLRCEPAHLFLAGQPAPGSPVREPLHILSDRAFGQRISELGGMDAELLADDRTARLLLSAVRADFALWETHEFAAGPPLASAITVFGGHHDPRTRVEDLDGWRTQTTGRFRLQLFAGGHFFVRTDRDALVSQIAAGLMPIE